MDENQRAASKRKVKQNPKTPKRLINQVKKAMVKPENILQAIANGIPVEVDENAVTADVIVTDEQANNYLGKYLEGSKLSAAKELLGLPDDFEYSENLVFVDATELNTLVQQNHDLKSEVGKLVGLFQHFTGLFSGANIMSIAMKIPSLIKDEGIKAQVELVLPIIEKYKPKA